MAGVGSGMPSSGGRSSKRHQADPRPYDFRRPNKLNRDHVRTLQIAYETFGRQFGTILTSTLRVVSQANLVTVQQMPYAEYVSSLPAPTFMAITSVQPLQGAGILQMQQDTAMICVDRLLGGPGKPDQPERSFTEIESELLRSLSARLVRELRYAFEGIVRIEPAVESLETSPQFAQIAAPSDVVIVASFELRVGDQDGVATVCLPFGSVFPVLEVAVNARRLHRGGDAHRSTAALAERLSDVEVEVGLRFAPVCLTPREIVDLRPGDVLPLRHATSAPLRLTASETTFAYAVPGSKGKNLACLVVDEPENKETGSA